MIEIVGNIFDIKDADVICVTTNGVVKKLSNKLVMGKGIAFQFAAKWPTLPYKLGCLVLSNGNVVNTITYGNCGSVIVSFPTKNHWQGKSSLELIIKSAERLVELTDVYKWKKIILPRPGCTNGGLDWYKIVKPAIKNILDDRFYIITDK